MLLERIASHSQACCASRPVPIVQEVSARYRASRHHSIYRQPVVSREARTAHTRAHQDDREVIQGYTPANYISYAPGPENRCHHMVAVEVEAPASVCYDLWSNWARLVDFLDLVSQIGLDPDEPDMALFQAFYRWGRMPVMEIVFLARKVKVEQNKLIQFNTVWGLPAQGEVAFIAEGPDKTTVMFKLEHQLPWILVDMKVGVLGVQSSLREILTENMVEFKSLAEKTAREGGSAGREGPTSRSKRSQPESQPVPPATDPAQQQLPSSSQQAGTGSSSGSTAQGRGPASAGGEAGEGQSRRGSPPHRPAAGGEAGEGQSRRGSPPHRPAAENTGRTSKSGSRGGSRRPSQSLQQQPAQPRR